MSRVEKRISEEMRVALKAGDRERTATLRLLLNEIKNEAIRQQEEVDETGFLKLVRRSIKQRQESAAQYDGGGRAELADKERREIAILEAYLPEEVGDDELRAAIADLIAAEELSGPSAVGPLMKGMMARYAGRADGGRINQLVREALADD
jgi:uncharacterized protein YqeY